MDELIQQLTSQLGLDASTAQSVTGKAMAVLKQNVGDDVFQKVTDAIPGAGEAAESGQASQGIAEGDGGGLLGQLASAASSVMGGGASSGLELGSALQAAGLDSDKMGDFISIIVNFIREHAGQEVIDQILAKFPLLSSLIGSEN